MSADGFFTFLWANPFRPFRFYLVDGRSYEVNHPQMVKVGRDSIVYFYVQDPVQPFDHCEMISLLLIERFVYLESTAA